MADDSTPDLEKLHPRPDQAEEPVDDVGASNVDLDEARHGPDHTSPAVPEPGHAPDDHGDHPVESPTWVLVPVLVGLLIGIVLVVVIGANAGATPFHAL